MLLSVLIIGCIATVTSAGTWAYFNDVATSDDDTVQAGTLELNDEAITSANLNVTNAQPGDSKVTVGTVTVQNTGSLNGVAVAQISGIVGADLGQYIQIFITDSTGTDKLLYNGPASGATYSANLGAINANGGNYNAVVKYSFPENHADQNAAQGDTFEFNIDFTLNQA
ncbi:MAG: TasA family protein [Methanosarcina vacuolata]|nr:TasA family protein [Methanosarcina vacuolata]